MISDSIVDAMFAKLDLDGGGTLDMVEIATLFKENSIPMSVQQVADMFAESKRKVLLQKR